jgi:hypothetical protein
VVKPTDRPNGNKFWLNDELVNAYMDHCKDLSYERTTFHHSTFGKLMVKVNRRVDKYDIIEKFWGCAKRFHGDHPKCDLKQEGVHFFPNCDYVH